MRVGPFQSLSLVLGVIVLLGVGWAPIAAQQSSSPAQALYELLVTEPFRDDELPRGFARPVLVPSAVEELDDGAAIGGVEVFVAIPDLASVAVASHRIVYMVYATPTDAEQAVLVAQARTERQAGEVAAVAGFDYSAILLKTKGSALGSTAVGSVCLVHVDVVVVAGVSVLGQNAESQADLNATDLAQAGIDHLDRLIFEATASATPAAVRG